MKNQRIFLSTFIALMLAFNGMALANEIGNTKPAIENPGPELKEPLLLAQASTDSGEKNLKPQYGGVLKMIWRRCPPNLGSPTTRSWGYVDGAYPIIETLLKFDADGNPTYGNGTLATGLDIAPDGKSTTLYLRKGVMFHDGTELTADAVKYHIEHMKYSPVKFKHIKSVDVVDKHTVRLNLSEWDGALLENFFAGHGMIASPTAISKPSTPENQAKDHTIGTGPFKFVDWERDVFIKYTKNENYWDKGKPYLDGMEYLFISDPVTGKLAFESGQAHIINDISAKIAHELKMKGYRVEALDLSGPALVGDSAHPDSPFAKKKVRQALGYAIDRKAIADALGFGFYKPVYQATLFPMGINPDIEGRKYDPGKAKQLLAEAGYPNGFKTKIIAMKRENHDAIGAVQNYLAEVGIKAKIDIADRGRFSKLNKEGWHNALIWSMFIGGPILPSSIQRSLDTRGVRNHSALKPPGFQELLDQSLMTRDPDERKKYCQKLIRIIYDEAIMVPIYSEPRIAAMQKSVHGIRFMYDSPHPFIWYPADAWLSK